MPHGPPETPANKAHAIIDAILHSHVKEHPELLALDSLLHAIVEAQPQQSVQKFVEFNLAPLCRDLVAKYLQGTPVTALLDFIGQRLGVDPFKIISEAALAWIKTVTAPPKTP